MREDVLKWDYIASRGISNSRNEFLKIVTEKDFKGKCASKGISADNVDIMFVSNNSCMPDIGYVVVGEITNMRIDGPNNNTDVVKKIAKLSESGGSWLGGFDLRNWYGYDKKVYESKLHLKGQEREIRYTKHKKSIKGMLQITWKAYDVSKKEFDSLSTESDEGSDEAVYYDNFYDPLAPDHYNPLSPESFNPSLSLEDVQLIKKGIRKRPENPLITWPSSSTRTDVISREEMVKTLTDNAGIKISRKIQEYFADK